MASPSLAARAAILGVPYQPGKQPDPLGVVKAIEALDARALAASVGAIVRETLVDLSAVTNPPAHQMGWVTGDATAANNGIYENAGSPSAPNWQRRADLPHGTIHMINVGAGTPDVIVATSSLPAPVAPGAALFTLNIVATNTGPVTINGKPLLTNSGNEIVPGGLVAGGIYLFLDGGAAYRLLSDYASAAIVAAAEDAAGRAEAAAAGVNLPSIQPGDAGKQLYVNGGETGYELDDPTTGGNFVATRAAIKALDTATVTDAYLTEAGREGQFLWRAGDYSAQVSADSLEGIYIKANAIAATEGAWVRQRHDLGVDVRWFGALCDNVADDGAAINAAILALPVTGGIVRIPGMCRTTESIVIGDGTSSAVSTRYGISLVGTAPAVFTKDGSHPTASASGIRYDGIAGAVVIDVRGPMIGFAVKNLVIDGGGGAGNTGLLITSASMGETSDLVFKNCMNGYLMDCHSGTFGFEPDISANTDLVRGGNIVVQVPDMTGAVGFNFTGAADGSASTCFVNLDTVRVTLSATHVNYGMVFKVCDGVSIKNILIIANSTVPAGTYAVLYDYGTNNVFPCGNSLDMIDAGWNIPIDQQFINAGSPAAVAAPNHISNLSEVNGCRYPTAVANLLVDVPQKQASDLALTGLSAGIASTTMFVPKFGTRYRVSWFLPITTAGSAGNIVLTFSFKDAAGISRNVTASTVACNSTANSGQGSILIESSLSGPYLNYQVDFSGVTGSPQYSLYVTVERLN